MWTEWCQRKIKLCENKWITKFETQIHKLMFGILNETIDIWDQCGQFDKTPTFICNDLILWHIPYIEFESHAENLTETIKNLKTQKTRVLTLDI